MIILKNTYPRHEGAAFGEVGDKVYWKLWYSHYELTRESDQLVVFSTAPVDKDGNLRSNGKKPTLTGSIAQVKSKGWELIIGD